MLSLPSILVSPRSAVDFPCFLSGDVVLIQEAKGLRQCIMIGHQCRIPYSDNVSLSRSRKCLCLVEANFSCRTTNQKHYSDLGNNASSVWIFCDPFLHVSSQENQLWYREMSAVFSAYLVKEPYDPTTAKPMKMSLKKQTSQPFKLFHFFPSRPVT